MRDSLIDSLIDRAGKAGVAGVAQDAGSGEMGFEKVQRVVVAAVVDDDDLRGGNALAQGGGDAVEQHGASVVVHDDDGETPANGRAIDGRGCGRLHEIHYKWRCVRAGGAVTTAVGWNAEQIRRTTTLVRALWPTTLPRP